MLISGIIWGAFTYVEAGKITNLDEFHNMRPEVNTSTEEYSDIRKIIDHSRKIVLARNGGSDLAENIYGIRKGSFNTDEANFYETTERENIPQVIVRGLMLSGESRYALINTSRDNGMIIKQGDRIPNIGRVISIKHDGITVSSNGENYIYKFPSHK